MTQPEDVLRSTFREREEMIGPNPDLLPGVRARIRRATRRRRTATSAAAALAVVTVFAGTVTALRPADGGDRITPLISTVPPIPSGWRWESALGAQVAVPGTWGVNDFGCGMSRWPTVVRVQGSMLQCFTPEPVRKEVAILTRPGQEGTTVPRPDIGRPYRVSGLDARRHEWRRSDTRYAGMVWVPSRNVILEVRTHRQDVTRRILDSLHFASVDHNGCPTDDIPRPRTDRPGPSFVPADPAAVAVCHYAATLPLQSSVKITGRDARDLATALNQAEPGSAPRRPDCTGSAPEEPSDVPDVVLLVEDDTGQVVPVSVKYSGCADIGLHNGERRAVLTKSLLKKIMKPLKTAYAWSQRALGD